MFTTTSVLQDRQKQRRKKIDALACNAVLRVKNYSGVQKRTAKPPRLAPTAPTSDQAKESRVVARGSFALGTIVGVMARLAGS